MKLLTQLAAVAQEGVYPPSRGVVAALHHEIAPGCILRIELDDAGLRVFNGDVGVAVPLADLVALAQSGEPRLIPERHA